MAGSRSLFSSMRSMRIIAHASGEPRQVAGEPLGRQDARHRVDSCRIAEVYGAMLPQEAVLDENFADVFEPFFGVFPG